MRYKAYIFYFYWILMGYSYSDNIHWHGIKKATLSTLPGVFTLIRMVEVGNQQLIMTNVKGNTNVKKNERVKLI